ncbi:UDP-N-acetylglucosamine 1-carboxyvinyltransferase [Fenollaria sporofastidiosus]|uniref:UDP-N-acetylglucosamine 1-carboxyvinyltransferase n=1 Tax=Fenollaria sporofastidiosus TaxID=2811778 RepID=UPI001C00125D|nr:UDP-N-acetylglucosamine 1-carboxyvinyltransferase [Fenollaria sporofastidiosus]
MAKLLIQESNPLLGTVRVSGAKNAALPILAATILGTEDIILEDLPKLKDVEVMCEVLSSLGATIEKINEHTIKINSNTINKYEVDYQLMHKMRASFIVMGALIGRMGKARSSMPGGCAIGARPVDLHLKGFRSLGVNVDVEENDEYTDIFAHADNLAGNKIYLDFPSVGATQNIILAAVLAQGETVIDNAAMEPEIVDMVNFLNKMGAKIYGAGTSTIRIRGVEKLFGATHQIMPDRIEAGTFMVAAAATHGDIILNNVIVSHMRPVIAKLREAGCDIYEDTDTLRIVATKKLKPIKVKTLPYPGFPTDMQAQFMALETIIEGESEVIETVFENRFMHVDELRKLGANIDVEDRTATVKGVDKLHGAEVRATDLRAGAALVIAALCASGDTKLSDIYHIDRGYEDFEEKFRSLGAKVYRVEE